MPTTTSNYALLKPLVADPIDEDLWGGYLNDDMDDIDSLLKQGITLTNQSVQTTGFTATVTISTKYLYPCDATSGAFAATLPTAASAGNGGTVFFKKDDASANAITITRAASDTIDGATTLPISTQYSTVGLVSDGSSKWRVFVPQTAAVFMGDTGSGGTSGLVPAPTAGYAAQKRVLGAGGSWVRTPLYAKYSYQVSSGTGGGTPTADAWTTRPLSNELYDDIGITLASNQLTVPVGTFYMSSVQTFSSTDASISGVHCRLRNITDSTTDGIFMSGFSPAGGSSFGVNYFVMMNKEKVVVSGSPKVFELQYFIDIARATTGLGQGYAAPGDTERYVEWIIEQVE